MKNGKRILSVTLKRMADVDADTSWLGEYSSKVKSAYTIDRNHEEDCPRFWAEDSRVCVHCQGVAIDCVECGETGELPECDCCEIGYRDSAHFNPPAENYAGLPDAVIRKYCLQDYQRMEALNRGVWCYLGIGAEAQVSLGASDTVQTIHGGACWGIESDAGEKHLREFEQEALAELRRELVALGFSKRAVAKACKEAKRVG